MVCLVPTATLILAPNNRLKLLHSRNYSRPFESLARNTKPTNILIAVASLVSPLERLLTTKKKKKRKLIDSPPGVCRRCRGKHEKSYLANIKEWTGFQMEVYLEVIKTSLRHCCLIVSPRRLARGGGRRWLLAPSLSELFNGVTMVIFICSVFSVLGSLRKISDVWYRIFESFINTCYSLFVIWSRIKF